VSSQISREERTNEKISCSIDAFGGSDSFLGGAKKEVGGTVYLWMYYPVVVAGCLAQLMDGLVEGFNDPQDIKRF